MMINICLLQKGLSVDRLLGTDGYIVSSDHDRNDAFSHA